MPRAKRKLITPTGRPQKKIDWDVVDRLLRAGCNGTQIAPHFDIHPDTLYERTILEKGSSFSDYQALKRLQGDSELLNKQHEKALKGDGDNTMLIFLGKVRLNQRETTEIAFSPETVSEFKGAMEWINKMQSKNVDNK